MKYNNLSSYNIYIKTLTLFFININYYNIVILNNIN